MESRLDASEVSGLLHHAGVEPVPPSPIAGWQVLDPHPERSDRPLLLPVLGAVLTCAQPDVVLGVRAVGGPDSGFSFCRRGRAVVECTIDTDGAVRLVYPLTPELVAAWFRWALVPGGVSRPTPTGFRYRGDAAGAAAALTSVPRPSGALLVTRAVPREGGFAANVLHLHFAEGHVIAYRPGAGRDADEWWEASPAEAAARAAIMIATDVELESAAAGLAS